MRKYLISISALLILAIGYGLYLFQTPTPRPILGWIATPVESIPMTYAQSVELSQKRQKEDIDLYNLAIKNQDTSLCQKIVSSQTRLECIDIIRATQAQTARDIHICDTLTQTGNIILCRDNILAQDATEKGNKEICHTIQTPHIALFCQKQVDTIRYAQAQGSGTLTEGFCASLIDDLSTECRRTVKRVESSTLYIEAIETQSPQKCDALQDETLRASCTDAVILQLAVAARDVKQCEAIIDSHKKSSCRSTIGTQSDAVQLPEIVATGDIGACNRLTEKKYQYQCSDMITLQKIRSTGDTSLCTNLFNTGMQFACSQMPKGASDTK